MAKDIQIDSPVFVVIVTYNGAKWLHRCLSAALASDTSVKLIIVDNCSTDNSIEIIQSFPQDHIHLIQTGANLGFGKANNVGIKKALDEGAEYIYLLNQDAYLDTNTLSVLAQQISAHPEYGIISPLHLNGSGDSLDENFGSDYISPLHCKNLYYDFVLKKNTAKIYPAKFVCAAGWMLSKNCIKEVGGFSPTFYHYGEDTNFCHRLLFKKLKIGIYPNVKMNHDREKRLKKKDELYSLNFLIREWNIFSSRPTERRKKLSNLRFTFSKILLVLKKRKIQYIPNVLKLSIYIIQNKAKVNKIKNETIKKIPFLFIYND